MFNWGTFFSVNKKHFIPSYLRFSQAYTNGFLKKHMQYSNYSYGKHKLNKLTYKSFISFISISSVTQKTTLAVNKSFSQYFVNSNKKGSSSPININKYYCKYLTVLDFIYNIYYYRLNSLVFGNIFLKNEIYALNWTHLSTTKLNLRLNQLLIFITPLKRNEFFKKLIKFITFKENVTSAFIFDVLYHKTTLSYLRTLSILTIGPLTVTNDLRTLDVIIPVPNDNIFLYFFFIKTIQNIKYLSEQNKYFFYKKTWTKYIV
jgi:hypothetical protein